MRNQKGFTLLEVMVGIAVIAIVSGPLLQMFITSNHVGRRSYEIDKANTVAVATVEEIKENPQAQLALFTPGLPGEYTKSAYYDNNFVPCAQAQGVFRSDITVSKVPFTGGEEIIGSSYIPELIDEEGNSYRVDIDYNNCSNNTSVEVTFDTGEREYTIISGSAVFEGFSTTMQIPEADFTSDENRIIPFILLVPEGVTKTVDIRMNNLSGIDADFYIYGDPTGDLVTVIPEAGSTGSITVNYMQYGDGELSFNKYSVNVRVYRQSDGSELADYESMIYIAY